jgi:hypothetical protein
MEPAMNVIVLFKAASFDDSATRAMGEAFDRACVSLKEFGRSDLVHEIMAKRIIAVAKTGERDPDQLYAEALSAFDPKPAKKSAVLAETTHQPRMKSYG